MQVQLDISLPKGSIWVLYKPSRCSGSGSLKGFECGTTLATVNSFEILHSNDSYGKHMQMRLTWTKALRHVTKYSKNSARKFLLWRLSYAFNILLLYRCGEFS
ncbi:hypothetical protein Plhal304r1_c067g0155041 [Plasmopara halstedii]